MQNIALISDFGYSDNSIGIMKGVINQIAPSCNIIDINHNILPYGISQAAFQLESAFNFFAKGTLFICAVDIKMISKQDIIFVEESGYFFIAPNNGILSPIISSESKFYTILDANAQTNHFHLIKLLSDFAAEFIISKKHNFPKIEARNIEMLKDYYPQVFSDKVIAKVLHIDNYGKVITNLKANHLQKLDKVLIKHLSFSQINNIYSDENITENVMYIGNSNYIEFASNSANFAQMNDVKIGDFVVAFLTSN